MSKAQSCSIRLAVSLSFVLQLGQMGNTITVRLPEDLAQWLQSTADRTGVSPDSLIREQLEKARVIEDGLFLKLAGKVSKAPDLSMRKGFSTR